MRIISQGGKIDLPYESFCISIDIESGMQIIAWPIIHQDDRGVFLATYSSTEKARRAMEMLHEEYCYEKKFGTVYCGANKIILPAYPDYCFQFPADEDLEVEK